MFVPDTFEPLKVEVNAVPATSSPKIISDSKFEVPVAAPSILILVLSAFETLPVVDEVEVWNWIVPPTPVPFDVAVAIVNIAALWFPPPPLVKLPLMAMSPLDVPESVPK